MAVSLTPAVTPLRAGVAQSRPQPHARSVISAVLPHPASRRAARFSPSAVESRVVAAARSGLNAPSARTVCRAASGDVSDSGLSSADPSRWITGVTPNNNVVRLAALAVALALATQGKALGMSAKALGFIHLSVWAAWFGTMFYTTFVAGIAMFKTLPRQTFRDVQEVLFPAYFQISTACIALLAALAPLALAAVSAQQWQLLGVALGSTLLNLAWLEPETTKVMKGRAALEKMSTAEALALYSEGKEAKMKAFGKDFGKYHGMSSLFNLAAFVCAVVYAWSWAL